MNLLIIGYGKMGKAVEETALERNHRIAGIIDMNDQHNQNSIDSFRDTKIDVAIEFTQPDAAFDNITQCLKNDIKVISGTTGWLDLKYKADEICTENNGTFFYASNFSIGVNIFFKLNKYLAGVMAQNPGFLPEIKEIHHKEKKDAPSGTAISLAESIIQHIEKINVWKNAESKDKNVLPIISERKDKVPGTHIITYSSETDIIKLEHIARSRRGFALGAVLVAEWIIDKKGILTMEDFLNF